MLDLPVVHLDPGLPLPAYARTGDAGADLVARDDAVLIAGGGRAKVATGISVAIPDGHAGLVLPRSGLALRHGVTVLNAPVAGVDQARGELNVVLLNTDPTEDYVVRRGDRIAQLVIVAVEAVKMTVVADLPGSERGTGGFGHSGR